jgi:hypothetical protein
MEDDDKLTVFVSANNRDGNRQEFVFHIAGPT